MAVSNGIPAASSDRKVIVSTKKATTTPMMSVRPMPAPLLVYMSPPSVTVNLAPGGGFAAFSTSGTVSSGRSV